MGKILLLPESVSNRIAAGEVIERPASVVKELIENALDADARSVEVVVESGGTGRIEVADDGIGMDGEDARLAFARHATSKIREADDILRIASFGFRGEALPSVASVSEVELVTAPEEGEGTRIVLRGGRELRKERIRRGRGTTVVVRDLFYNTPARRTFLKSERTEEKQIRRAVLAHALAEPEVAFRYVRDGEEVFHLPAGEELPLRIARIFGRAFAEDLVFAEGREHGPSVAGFVSKIEAGRGNRDYQYIHVNRRPVQQSLLQQAVSAAYRDLLPPGRHPAFFLALTIDPEFVDVNIHPTKREVRFSPERAVFGAIETAVRRALRAEASLPRFWREAAAGPRKEAGEHPSLGPLAAESGWSYHPAPEGPRPGDSPGEIATGEAPSGGAPSAGAAPDGRGWLARADLTRVQQIGNMFLVTACPDGVIVADQHTVHERILFEETLARIEARSREAQRLLFPETVEADPDLVRAAEEYADLIEAAGFEVRPAGPRALLLEGTPVGVRRGEPARLLLRFLEYLVEAGEKEGSRERRVAASLACHGAVRAGDPLAPEERGALLRRLAACREPLRCPHGRPTYLAIAADELARRFLRT